jgi:hypothetical protein
MRTTRLMLATLSLALPLTVVADPSALSNKKSPPRRDPTLVEQVQNGIDPAFFYAANALSRGWANATACVSGPNEGAMGHHLVFPDPAGDPKLPPLNMRDGELDPGHPEAFIYEPVGGGNFRLVGVEFIQIAEDWATRFANKEVDTPTPRVNGHLMNLVGTPNRYGLPAFYELHVWAFESNPLGSFADFNTRVTCSRAQPDDLTH